MDAKKIAKKSRQLNFYKQALAELQLLDSVTVTVKLPSGATFEVKGIKPDAVDQLMGEVSTLEDETRGLVRD